MWRKSSVSASTGNCVEVADLGLAIGVRDSKNPTGPALRFSRDEFTAFVDAVKDGAFDLT
ncbi:MAG TPA: DUF397 domain-containing protein [Mycobacteriales bacterium]